ncbi:MAG: glycoside hydrolase family 127 protein [Planctomycetes bacterium]|nr:glycoside hydrolase family 127 protein [Planctomycetota bacterium]
MITARLLPPVLVVGALFSAAAADSWKAPEPASPDDLRLAGTWAAAQARSADRMAAAPLDKPEFILADVSLKQHRKFVEYSGDISGRWIGAAAFLAPLYPKPFAAFPAILAEIPTYQKRDGHFGADQQLPKIDRTRDMPILWGNGRLLIGLVEVYQRTGDQKALETAKRLGDYFIATDPVYNKAENLRSVGGTYADGFVTCYFSCIEGLVALGRVTKDKRYLDQGKRIAELALTVDNFDGLHSHGRLCAVRGFADLYAATGQRRWRQAAERDWRTFMERYRLPTGGVKEVLSAKCERDEGCAVCD